MSDASRLHTMSLIQAIDSKLAGLGPCDWDLRTKLQAQRAILQHRVDKLCLLA